MARNHVQVAGHGSQAVIFGHGFGVDLRAWHRVAPRFQDSHCVVQYDLAGWGRSDPAHYAHARYDSLTAHADDLLEICHTLNLRDAYYVGHSAGGMIGALAAIREPACFRKLVMIGASPRYIDDESYVGGLALEQVDQLVAAIANDYAAWCQAIAPIATNEPAGSRLSNDLLGNFAHADPSIALQFAKVIFYSDHREDLRALRTETLIVQAAKDAFVPDAVADFMLERIPGARLVSIKARGGHYPHLGAPAEVKAVLDGFLRAS